VPAAVEANPAEESVGLLCAALLELFEDLPGTFGIRGLHEQLDFQDSGKSRLILAARLTSNALTLQLGAEEFCASRFCDGVHGDGFMRIARGE